MSAVDEAFDSAFATLRERYISTLGVAVSELRKFSILCDFEETNADIVTSTSQLAHRLSGTGETLGFPDISSAAMALEQILGSNPGSSEAATAARTLARACEAAAGHAQDTKPPLVADLAAEDAEVPPEKQSVIPQFVTVHNDPALANLLADVCANHAGVINFADCAGALGFLGNGHADLLLIDLDCQGCPPDGVAALYKRARAQGIPIMAIASQRRSATILHALSDGKIECLIKPVEAALLHRKLFETLERRHLVAIICDDDPVIREFLRPRFESRGFQVQVAKDGDELLEMAGRAHPSIILLDRVMPGMDGINVLRMLKSKSATHRIPVVMLTSRSQPQEMAEGLGAGAAAYLAKPFSPEQVVAKCLEILGLAKLQRA